MATAEEQLAQILSGKREELLQTNPYYLAAQAWQGPQIRSGKENLESGIASGLQGIARGLLGAYGISQAKNDYNSYARDLAPILKAQVPSAAALGDSRYQALAPFLAQGETERQNKLEDVYNQAMAGKAADVWAENQKKQEVLQAAMGGVAPQGQNDSIITGGGIVGGGMPGASSVRTPQGIATPAAMTLSQRSDPLSGLPPEARQMYVEAVSRGVDPNTALTQAAGLYKDKMAPEQGRDQEVLKGLQDVRKKADTLKNVGNTVLSAVDAAGRTGPGWVYDQAQTASELLAPFSEDQRRKLQATQTLDTIRPDVIATNRTVGAGATSDYESEMLVGAGPSSKQLPETNKLLGELYLERGKLEGDHADFLEDYYSKNGTLTGAEELWRQYIGDYKLMDRDAETGQLMVNKNRKDWRTILQGGQGTPPIDPTAGGAPSGGRDRVDQLFYQGIIPQESGGRADAVGPMTRTGDRARGLSQVMPETGREVLAKMGLVSPDAPLEQVGQLLMNPAINEMVGKAYFQEQMQNFGGNERLALAAYNAGPGAVRKYGGIPPYQETINYVRNALRRAPQAPTAEDVGETTQPAGGGLPRARSARISVDEAIAQGLIPTRESMNERFSDKLEQEDKKEPLGSYLLSKTGEAALNLPSDLYNTGKAAVNFARHPIQSLEDAGVLNTTKVVGNLAAGASGALTGGAAGAFGGPLAPVTVPLGAALGGAAGLLGFKKASEAGESRDLSKLALTREDLGDAAYNSTQGLLAAGLAKIAGGAARGTTRAVRASSNLAKTGAVEAGERALAVKPKDLARSAERGVSFVDETGARVPVEEAEAYAPRLKEQAARIRESDFFKKLSNDPKKAAIQVTKESKKLNATKNSMVEEIESGRQAMEAQYGEPIKFQPDWSLAESYIQKGKGTAGYKPKLARELGRIQNDWARKGGTFQDLIEFKQELAPGGKLFTNAEGASVKLREAIELGVKRAAEKIADSYYERVNPSLVGKFEDVNRQISDLLTISKSLNIKGLSEGLLSRTAHSVGSVGNLLRAGAASAVGGVPLGAAYLGVKGLTEAFPASSSRALARLASILSRTAQTSGHFSTPFGAATDFIKSPVGMGGSQALIAEPERDDITKLAQVLNAPRR